MKVLVNIDVPELAPAIEFYCAALGLQLNRIIDGDVAELTGGSCLIYLLEKPPDHGRLALCPPYVITLDTGHRFTSTSL